MTAANFQAAITFIWASNRDGSRNDSAPGETFLTVKGITQQTWDYAVAQCIVAGSLGDATDDQLRAVYRALFWAPMHCSSLPSGVDLLMFANGCLMGTGHEARQLQHVVGTTQDGMIGPLTIAATMKLGAKATIDGLIAADLAYLMTTRMWSVFQHGWTTRLNDTKVAAYQLAGISVAAIARRGRKKHKR